MSTRAVAVLSAIAVVGWLVVNARQHEAHQRWLNSPRWTDANRWD